MVVLPESERAFDLSPLNRAYLAAGFTIVDQIYPGLISYILYFNPEAFPRLNIGSERGARAIFNAEKALYRNIIGRKLSFATMTLLRRR